MMASAQSNQESKALADMGVSEAIRLQWQILGHEDLGVTELRVFDPRPQVAYADSPETVVRLCHEIEGNTSGVYIGVQPRPAHLFDLAPNDWASARGGRQGNCACDCDIEYITTAFFDIDVASPERQRGHPASQQELEQTLRAARQLLCQDGFGLESVICCSGNGHYVVTSIVPIPVDGDDIALKFKRA